MTKRKVNPYVFKEDWEAEIWNIFDGLDMECMTGEEIVDVISEYLAEYIDEQLNDDEREVIDEDFSTTDGQGIYLMAGDMVNFKEDELITAAVSIEVERSVRDLSVAEISWVESGGWRDELSQNELDEELEIRQLVRYVTNQLDHRRGGEPAR